MSDRWFPKDKEELMLSIDRERASLWNLVNQLSETQMSLRDSGGWSPKDHFAHLIEWMKSLIGADLGGRPRHEVFGVDKKVTDDDSFDRINEILFKRNRFKSHQELMTDFTKTCSELYSKLSAISFEDMMKPRFPDDPEKRPVMNWILGNTTEHFAEHREYIQKLVSVNRS